MVSEKKIIDFNAAGRVGNPKLHPVVAECRALFQREFKALLARFFEKTDDELFALSDKATSHTLQEMYFEAMRYLRREREAIERGYLGAVLKGYDEFWLSSPKPKPDKQAETKVLDEESLALVDNEALEEELAISTLIAKGNNLHYKDLYALGKRFAKLHGCAEVDEEDNPLGPSQLGKKLAEVLLPLTLELKVKLILFKFYERYVISELGSVYDLLNETLAKGGVLPEIPRRPRNKANTQDRPADEVGKETHFALDQAAYIQTLQAMHSLLAAWRTQMGLPSVSASAYEPGVVVSDTQEVVAALSAFQDPKRIEALYNGEETNLKLMLVERLRQEKGGKRALAQMDEDIIDMIGMIFDFILEDRNLPTPLKALIGRLQIPIIKVAILDKSFFSKKSHPARLLLNQLAHAGIGLSGDEAVEQNPVFRKISTTVERILLEFEQDVGLFDTLLQEFVQFMEEEGQRSQKLEERTRQATQSKEQLLVAKKHVAECLAARLRGRELSPRLKRFFLTTWKDVLLLACLRQDKTPEDFEAKLALTDALLWSLTPPKDEGERKRIKQRIPGLLRALHQELEAISLDPKQIALLFKELESVHQALLNLSRDAFDSRLERELAAISANLPEVDGISVSELTEIQPEAIEEEIVLAEETLSTEEDEFVVRARELQVGDWLELDDGQGKAMRVKLSWISKVTGVRVFVNRRGMKVAEYTLQGLAAEFRRGRAKAVEGKIPLMDRALTAMMNALKHPAKQAGSEDFQAAPALR
ncbi:MAG: DUF1631 domain-containing protein [Methylohalobius sp.]|nr:DUF1631 domain-containing protein [Methylohalobius sp.]